MNDETIMTLEEVSEYLKIPMSSIYKISRQPDFPRMQVTTFGVRVRKSDLNAWLESKKRK